MLWGKIVYSIIIIIPPREVSSNCRLKICTGPRKDENEKPFL
jgi:hypothetical protein